MSEDVDVNGGGVDQNGGVEQNAGAGKEGGDQPWYASIEDENVRGLMEAKGYNSEADVAKAYYNLNRAYKGSAEVFELPKEGDDASFMQIMDKLGRPSEAKAYETGLDESVSVNEDFVGAMKNAAHEAGLTKAQFQKFAKFYQDFVESEASKGAEVQRAQADANMRALEEKFGKNTDAKVAAGQRAVHALGIDDELLDKLDSSIGMPQVMELFAVLGEKIGQEDKFVTGGGEPFVMTPEAARVEMRRLQADADFVGSLSNMKHPQRQDNLAKWNRITKLAAQK